MKKAKHFIDKTEKKIKDLDKKIILLKHELYTDALSASSLAKQNVKTAEYTEKQEALHQDCFYPDIFRYFQSFEHILNRNAYFNEIIDVLKNEVYAKPPPSLVLKENGFFQSITFTEKALYSQWILQTLVKKLPRRINNSSKCDLNSSFEALSCLRKIMICCDMPVEDDFQATLNILNSSSAKILSDNEQDLLIFIHATARMRYIYEMLKTVDLKLDNSQLLCSKATRYEIQTRYFKLLNELKFLMDGIEKVDFSNVVLAVTKSEHVDIEVEEITQAFENFKGYITYVSGQANGILNTSQSELQREMPKSEDKIYKELKSRVQQCIDEGRGKCFEDLGLNMTHELFEEDAKNTICCLKEFISRIKNMGINDVNDVRLQLFCLKNQVKFLLQSKWNFQKHLLPFICEDAAAADLIGDKELHMMGRFELLFENMKETMFYLKTLEEIEFSKHYSVIAGLCELRHKKEILIQEFRNFLIRIGHQLVKDVPIIKRNLLEFNKRIQILFNDYHKYRVKLQFLSASEFEYIRSMFEDIESIIIADVIAYKDRKCIGLKTVRRLNVIKSEVVQEKTKGNLEEIKKIVDETMEFLHLLDETLISKKFPAMRYLCELYYEKEQILCSFEDLLFSMHRLNIEDDERITHRLIQLCTAADNLIKKYETLGMQLMLFADVMAIVNKENNTDIETYSLMSDSASDRKSKEENKIINVSELFNSKLEQKKLYRNLDTALKSKWFPAKQNLFNLLKEKQRTIQAFQNFLERMPELNADNTVDIIHSIRRLIGNAENVLRKYQSLRMQLIWNAADCVFSIK